MYSTTTSTCRRDGLLRRHAVRSDFGARARGVLDAGCDVALHCSGDMSEMQAIAAVVGEIGEASLERRRRAMATITQEISQEPYEDLAAKRDALLSYV